MPRQSKALVKEAKALGVDVDGRWGDETIQEHIDAVKADQAKGEADAKAKEAVRQLETEAGAGAGELAGVQALRAADGPAPVAAEGSSEAPQDGEPVADDHVGAAGEGLGVTADPVAEAEDAEDDDVADDDDAGMDSDEADGGGAAPASGDPTISGGLGSVHAGGDAGTEGDAGLVSGDARPGGSGADLGDGGAAGVDPVQTANKALTLPMVASFGAASAIYGAFVGGADGGDPMEACVDWFGGEEGENVIIALVGTAVPFIRTWPDAPVEALYSTLRDSDHDLGLEGGWVDLPAANRIAWEAFRDTLLKIDAAIEAEHAKIMAAADVRPVRRIPIDESTLEQVDDTFELSDSGKAQAKRDEAAALDRDLSLTGF